MHGGGGRNDHNLRTGGDELMSGLELAEHIMALLSRPITMDVTAENA